MHSTLYGDTTGVEVDTREKKKGSDIEDVLARIIHEG